jgi:hypothetical protein
MKSFSRMMQVIVMSLIIALIALCRLLPAKKAPVKSSYVMNYELYWPTNYSLLPGALLLSYLNR